MKEFVGALKIHWLGIITNFTFPGVHNGILEGLNQKIQLAKRRARGFANMDNFIDMAYFLFTHLIRYRASLFGDSHIMREK